MEKLASSATHYVAPAVTAAQRDQAQTSAPLKHSNLYALLHVIEKRCSLDFCLFN